MLSNPTVKKLLLLAKKLAPIPAFGMAFAAWGFVFSRYSDPPIDMAGRALAAAVAAASASAAAQANRPPALVYGFTPRDACLQQRRLFPSQYGLLDCTNDDETPLSFGWAWAPAPPPAGDKAGPRPRPTATAQPGDEGAAPGGESGE
ncbi:MAG: hypothetical protein U0359_24095 [Byssovorax sp.]